jgi:Flp pilus assembly CpaE family ATPase
LLLGNPDVPSLKGLVNLVKKLSSHHFDPEKIKVIINRFNSKNQIDVKEFERMSNHPIAAFLPNNFVLCNDAVNKGESIYQLNPKADLSKKIDELAEIIKKFSGAKKHEAIDNPSQIP